MRAFLLTVFRTAGLASMAAAQPVGDMKTIVATRPTC